MNTKNGAVWSYLLRVMHFALPSFGHIMSCTISCLSNSKPIFHCFFSGIVRIFESLVGSCFHVRGIFIHFHSFQAEHFKAFWSSHATIIDVYVVILIDVFF